MRKVLPAVLATAAMTLLAAPPATQQANPPQPSIKQRGDMIFEALSTRPANVAALKAALTDIGNLQVTFRSKPLHRWVEGATLMHELLHCIDAAANVDLSEHQVRLLAPMLTDTLGRNGLLAECWTQEHEEVVK